MRGAGRDEEAEAGVRGDEIEQRVLLPLVDRGPEFAGIAVPEEACPDSGVLPCAQHIPELFLAEEVVSLGCNLVPGMHLQRHIAPKLEQAHAYGELPPVVLVEAVSGDAVEVGVHKFPEAVAGEPAVPYQGVAVAEVCELEFFASPGILVLQGAELHRV